MCRFNRLLWGLCCWTALWLSACGRAGESSAAGVGKDTLAVRSDSLTEARLTAEDTLWRVAVLPTLDCLPLYYAEEAAWWRQGGVAVELREFAAQGDADTALLRGRVSAAVTDLVRVAYYNKEKNILSAQVSTDGGWMLLAAPGLRLRKLEQLKNRMVAVARHSASDFVSGRAAGKAGCGYADFFRPQINSLPLRTSMLLRGQVDAAVLPEPLASKAQSGGAVPLFVLPGEECRLGVIACRTATLNHGPSARREEAFRRVYDRAVDSLNRRGVEACRQILQRRYGLSDEEVRRLKLPRYRHAAKPSEADVQRAADFLRLHERP